MCVKPVWAASALLMCGYVARTQVDPDPQLPLPEMAKLGKDVFDRIAADKKDTMEGMAAQMQSNPLFFPTLTDFWAAYELTDRKRKPALLVDDMQVEYEPYVRGILPQTKLLIDSFRRAGLPIIWSTWWRWGPDDGYFNTMDRFYGPIGWRTEGNALYNHKQNGGDVLSEVAPVTDEEWRRVMHKSYSLDMFDEHAMQWLVPAGQGTLHEELQKLGVDTVVQLGAWTDDCIISTAFHAFSHQYDVVVVEDGVSTASKQHFNAIEVMRGAAAKVLFAADVAKYIDQGLPVVDPSARNNSTSGHAPAAIALARASQHPALRAPAAVPSLYAGASGPADKSLQLCMMALVAMVGPASFVGGWLLRGRTLEARRHVRSSFLTLG